MFYTADLHLHTVLSACAEIEMMPEFILERAQELGLNLIAVTDHNSAENAAAMMTAAKGTGITVLPGMEVQTREEAHLLCLFDALREARALRAAKNDRTKCEFLAATPTSSPTPARRPTLCPQPAATAARRRSPSPSRSPPSMTC